VRLGGPMWASLALVSGLLAADAEAQLAPNEAIRPVKEYASADARAVAEAHTRELRSLYDAVRRCAPELDFQRHGIGFQRPRGLGDATPHLTVWVWLPPGPPLPGSDLGSRASAAFERYARGLLARSVALRSVASDARVGGYIVVLSWIGPDQVDGRSIAESLVLYTDKTPATDFVGGTLLATGFLARSEVRLFDGETEVKPPSFTVDDGYAVAPSSGC
jgi:hypothetical protein